MTKSSQQSSSVPFAPQPDPSSTRKSHETRNAVLESVKQRASSKDGKSRMKGKVGVITGVGPELGIGTASARLFAREGADHLYLLDFDDTSLGALAAELKRNFPETKVSVLKGDAAQSSTIIGLVDRVLSEEGRLDFFFANAGVSHIRGRPAQGEDPTIAALKRTLRRISETPDEEFSEVMRINALSVFLAIKYAAPAMAKLCPKKGKTIPGGSIVLTASIAGLRANAGPIPYSASKAAVVSMAQTASYELAGQNVRVNAVCPGLIQTDMTKAVFDIAQTAGKMDKMGVLNPTLRQGIGAEVAQLALFLASDDSSYVNGQAIAVDGGLSAGHPYVRARL